MSNGRDSWAMGLARRALCASAACAAVCAAGGCVEGRHFEAGRQAELRGVERTAYDQYLAAARENPGSTAVGDAMERVRAGAAAYWERQALLATDQGRFKDAWQFWMRTLEITPDDRTAVEMIRRLERDHGEEVAVARVQWLQRGDVALAAARPIEVGEPEGAGAPAGSLAAAADGGRTREEAQVADGSVQSESSAARASPGKPSVNGRGFEVSPNALAMANPRSASAGEDREGRIAASDVPSSIKPVQSVEESEKKSEEPGSLSRGPAATIRELAGGASGGGRDSAVDSAAAVRSVEGGAGSRGTSSEGSVPEPVSGIAEGGAADAEVTQPAGVGVPTGGVPRENEKHEDRKPDRTDARRPVIVRSKPTDRPKEEEGARPATIQPSTRRPERTEETVRRETRYDGEARGGPTDEFVCVLSKKDRRFPERRPLVDGIDVKVKDTDDDMEVDLNLYMGSKRVKKIRELELGRSQTFRGRSGRTYRLTVLSIFHKSHTVRIGVRPV